MTRSGTEPSTRDVLALANEVHHRLAEWGYHEAAAAITETASRWRDEAAVVVFAGDIKRGKSSLVNILVRRPGLLPVDADVATGVHVVIRNGADESASVTLLDDDATTTTTRAVDLAALDRYVSMSAGEALLERVVDVEVLLEGDLLSRGLALVDTPGVGGMAPGHRQATMSALSRADALVFTASVDAPLSRSEIDFLAEAGARIGRVAVCVTKGDLASADAALEMIAEDRGRVATRRAALAGAGDSVGAAALARVLDAPFLPVSAYLAERALQRERMGKADTASDLQARSGVPALTDWLESVAASRAAIRLTNVLHLLAALLEDAAGAEFDRARAASADPDALVQLRTQQQRLEGVVSAQAHWRATLGSAVGRMQAELGRAVTARLSSVRNTYRQALETAKGKELEALSRTLPEDLERSLHAAWSDLTLAAEQAFTQVVAEVAAELEVEADSDAAAIGPLLGGAAGQRDFAALVATARGDRDLGRFTAAEDGIPLAMQTLSLAAAVNAAAALLGVATGGLGLVAYGVGAAMSWPLVVLRRRHRTQIQTAQEWNRVVNETLFGTDGIAKELTTELGLHIMEGRERFERLIEASLVSRRRELEGRARELSEVARTEAGRRAEIRAGAEARMGELAALAARTRGYLGALGASDHTTSA